MDRFNGPFWRGKALLGPLGREKAHGGHCAVTITAPKGQRRFSLGVCFVLAAVSPALASCAQKSAVTKSLAQTSTANPTALSAVPAFSTEVLARRPGPARNPAPRRRTASLSRYDPKTGVYASERLISGNRAVPKGGGNYKVGKPYKVSGRRYVPKLEPNYNRTGVASWYGDKFHGRRTANGETYDMAALSAAHPTMPLPSYAYVTNLANGRTVLVRVNDRGPYAKGRIIDLSRAAANALSFRGQGVAKVRVRYAGRAPLNGSDHKERAFLRQQSWSGRTANIGPVSRASGLTKTPPVW